MCVCARSDYSSQITPNITFISQYKYRSEMVHGTCAYHLSSTCTYWTINNFVFFITFPPKTAYIIIGVVSNKELNHSSQFINHLLKINIYAESHFIRNNIHKVYRRCFLVSLTMLFSSGQNMRFVMVESGRTFTRVHVCVQPNKR